MPPKKKAANGYKFAEPLPKGTILEDIGKKKWKVGPSIGKGGFGEIYSAQEADSAGEKYPYVVKIEPHSNGPLFVEINFYIRHAKSTDIESFKKENALKTFGMPIYYGSGSHEYKGEKYRFLIMDKFGTDLYKLYMEHNNIFPGDTIFKLAIQILDVLEYIHARGYVHADIKAANILMGATKETQNKQVYLVDFGLATKYTLEKEFKPNPKKAHDGTIEFLSRDAHQGVQTRRGDLEILAYNLIQWLGCKLPWESKLSDPKVVQNSKEEHMASVPKMIKSCFGTKSPPKAIVDFLNNLKTLKFDTEPDYKKIKKMFLSGVKECGGSIGTALQFSEKQSPVKRNRTPVLNSANKKTKLNKKDDGNTATINDEEESQPKRRGRPKRVIVPEEEDDVEMDSVDEDNHSDEKISSKRTERSRKIFESKKTNKPVPKAKALTKSKKQDFSDSELSDVEMPLADDGANDESDTEVEQFVTVRRNKTDDKNQKSTKVYVNKKKLKSGKDGSKSLTNGDALEGYTEAMKEVMIKMKNGPKKRTHAIKIKPASPEEEEDMTGYTEEMKAIALKKKSKQNGKKTKPVVPVATTSKASDKKGLVKPSSKRLKEKPPVTHGDIAEFSDNSCSE